jgi:hypothetical protein
LSRAEEEVRQQHPEDTQLYLDFYSGGQPARVEIQQTRQNIADKLQMSGAEVAGVLRELAADDYIDLHYGRSGVSAGVTIRQKGRVALMEVPDPNAELSRRLEAITEAIAGLRGVDPEEKQRAAAAARELKTFDRGLAPGRS